MRRRSRMVLGQDIPGPNQSSSPCFQATQFSFGSQGINLSVAIGGRRAGAVATHGFVEMSRPAVGPNFAARFDIISGRHLVLTPLFDRVCEALCNREGCVTAADRLSPEQ